MTFHLAETLRPAPLPLERVALPGGEPDDSLAREFSFAQADADTSAATAWPTPEPARWQEFLRLALEAELAEELADIRPRQENSEHGSCGEQFDTA